MKFELFQYPLPHDGDLSDLNGFLSSRRVVSVSQSIVRADANPVLLFVVEYLDGASLAVKSGSADRVDYRQKLNAEDFALFSQLRTERKRLAEQNGVPVYTILTNAQLAEIVERRVNAIQDLKSISGMGTGRVEKFGEALIGVIAKFSSSSNDLAP